MNNIKNHIILKSSGEQEHFSEEKINKFLLNAGVNPDIAREAIGDLEQKISEVHSTSDIHLNVAEYLKKHAPINNYYNFSLKRAVMSLGPTGHPFEHLISEIFQEQGFRTEVGVVALGKCVTHEIDVVAYQDKLQYFIECKFHNTPGVRTDIQVALYTYARFLDVKFAMEQIHGQEKTYLPWLITNTKVTSEVFDYGDCTDMKVTAWYYPEGEGLRDLIVNSCLHPITLLYHLSDRKVTELLNRNIVTFSSLKRAIQKDQVHDILSDRESQHILEDIKLLTTNE
jgi:hypothetical protein